MNVRRLKKSKPSSAYLRQKAAEAAFDEKREALAARCAGYVEAGLTLQRIADLLNAEGIRTKTGKEWRFANIAMLMKNPRPPATRPVSKAEKRRKERTRKKRGVVKRNDIALTWVSQAHPELEQWRVLGAKYLAGKEKGLGSAIQGVTAWVDFLAKEKLPTDPAVLLLRRTPVPDLYESLWGTQLTHGRVLFNNSAHKFVEWVLGTGEFCEEDDDGRLVTSPAFRNPVKFRSRSGLPRHVESVRSTLPYGYIQQLRAMIAEGPNFQDWKFAQSALGAIQGTKAEKKAATTTSGGGLKVAPIWFEVDPSLIDTSDPDCVWRTRTRTIKARPGVKGGGRKKETICEMWSPVRWVALLLKLQLPLRTHQVRMLDSGEADTWRWQEGKWSLNVGALASGDDRYPYANGVFRRPSQLADGEIPVLMHVNTNKTADSTKVGSEKGYTVPWVVGGPLQEDPFYWLEKLRRWQERYNPIRRLTRWTELDGRHIPPKSDVQLAAFPDTAFLFRTPETPSTPHFPLVTVSLDLPWFACLKKLESELASRGDTLPSGQPIRLMAEEGFRKKNSNTTFFPLHSLRVSLITALALDGQIPLAILQKVAGHSRLVMTLYYTKPGAMQSRDAIQAGVTRLNELAGDTIVDWLANAEYDQLVQEAIANSPEALRAAVPEQKHLRSPVGWMAMLDGLCLVGGNNVEADTPGCHNGGANIGSATKPIYARVQGGARNCPMCRWFVTRPFFLPQLATRWNNVSYHCHDAAEELVVAERRLREIEDRRAAALVADQPFDGQHQFITAERTLEFAAGRFDDLVQTLAAITRLLERCRKALSENDGTSLLAVGGATEVSFAIEEVDSELLQVSGVCESSISYPDLNPGKAVLRQTQLIDAALMRDGLPPAFLMLTQEEQKMSASAFLHNLSARMNPANPALGRYEVISLIDARKSLRARLGTGVEEALQELPSGEHRLDLTLSN